MTSSSTSAAPLSRRMIVGALVLSTCGVGLATTSSAPAWAALNVTVTSSPYNATGNGTTNDRAAIQSAIDAVASSGGGTVTIPGGTSSTPKVFLTGSLNVKSNVTLNIARYAVVKQSQNPADYSVTPTKGRQVAGSSALFDTYMDRNLPLIFAGQLKNVATGSITQAAATNVKVTGAGTIQLTRASSNLDSDSILVHGIGFSYVTNYLISGITIAGASAYNVTMRNSDYGEISNVATVSPATINSDGISLMNSSHLSVHNNNLTTLDDGIYVWASYQDPRKSYWWDSDTARPSTDVEVYSNVIANQATNGSHGFLFILWASQAADKSQVEVARVNVHDNQIMATYPIGALNKDIYYPSNDKVPTKQLRFANNTLTITPGSSGSYTHDVDQMATTDLSVDNPVYAFAQATDQTGLYNSNFDGANAYPTELGLSFWSTEGTATSVLTGANRYGRISGFNAGYSSITEGVYLTPGTYTFGISGQSSGVPIRLVAVRAAPLSVAASTTFTNTAWAPSSISFTVSTAGVYRLGIDNTGAGSATTSYGAIDNATLTTS